MKDKIIVKGDFSEGSYVTVLLNGKEYTRKVRYSAKKWGDIYIVINNMEYTYSEFEYSYKN